MSPSYGSASLEGKRVLITGAAGDIGFAVARAFIAEGASVHLTDVDGARLADRARQLPEPSRVTSGVGDLAKPESVTAVATAALAALQHIDILVNNAAIQVEGDVEDCPPDLFELSYAINVRAPFLLSRAVVPSMRRLGSGAIINIASVHATAPGPKRIAYATTKTALLGMTRAMAVDLGRHGIRVNAVSPGATLTDQLRRAWERHDAGDAIMSHAIAQHPLGRIADVSDIAGAVLYLAVAPFVTGTELRVDGGFLAALRLLPDRDRSAPPTSP